MESSFALFVIFSLVLVGNTIAARKDPGEYWKDAMKDQPMPKAIEGVLSAKNPNCHTATEASNEQADQLLKDFEQKVEKAFAEDFEPRPNVSVYHDDSKVGEEKSFVKDFEPGPNLSVYHDDEVASKGDKSFVNDFEPRPNLSVYNH
ncbi:Organ-specific protein S2 [Vitis vinifera]|uniref:Organ-specific protein S2 n=2 Tax=Vitis vinifera TaxID=29760 RepID=A5AWY4_VITVI|nr:Organ-specific protein S2 [Vitis vinifera]CAN67243.1 hypothetical protein VITISV_017120 [Vitis vinifera]